jgi:hypothetical protein
MYGVNGFFGDYKNIFTCFGFEVFKLNNKNEGEVASHSKF